MGKYALIGGYTSEAWAKMIDNPGDRVAVVSKTVVPSFANVRGRSPSSAAYFTLPLIVRQRSPTFAIVRCGCRHGGTVDEGPTFHGIGLSEGSNCRHTR